MNIPQDQQTKQEVLGVKFSPSFYLPGDMNETQKTQLWQELSEICEDQWDESSLNSLVLFSKLHFSSGKKGHFLALEAHLEDDFFYAYEILMETLKENNATFRSDNSSLKFLSNPESQTRESLACQMKIGSFKTDEELALAVDFSQNELRLPLGLIVSSMDVMTTTQLGQSAVVRNLFTFMPNKDTLLKEQMHFIT